MFRKILNCIGSFLIFLIFPWFILLLTPIYIYRKLLTVWVKYFKKDFEKIVNSRSAMMGDLDNPSWNIVVPMVHSGYWEFEQFVENVQNHLIYTKCPKTHIELYPELRQYIQPFGGYMFWSKDKDFQIKNHVKMYQGPCSKPDGRINKSELFKIVRELLEKPFENGKSPWEINVLYNHVPDDIENNNDVKYTTIIFRVHHSVADGSRIEKLLLHFNDKKENLPKVPRANLVRKSGCKKFLDSLIFPLKAPYEQLKVLQATLNETIKWPNKNPLKKSKRYAGKIILPISQYKDAKAHHQVTFTSIVLSAVAGGLRTFLINNDCPVPSKIMCGMPFPAPNHTKKLRNHFTFASVALPIGESSPGKRVQIIDKNLKEFKHSTLPISSYLFYPLLGSLPAFFIKLLGKHLNLSCVVSYLPGTSDAILNRNAKLTETYFVGGVGFRNTGMTLYICSYQDKMHITAGLSICESDEKVEEFLQNIQEELDNLRNIPVPAAAASNSTSNDSTVVIIEKNTI